VEDVVTIMRLRCTCRRNLADVTVTDYNYDWVFPINHYAPRAWRGDTAYLMVTPRIKHRSTGPRVVGVAPDQREYQPPGAIPERTYSWRCWCGQNWQRTSKKIALAWDTLTTATPPSPGQKKVIVAVLDVDL
jgi:hypothetical protein